MIPNVLAIAGFDPSGGAGVLADIKTFAALRCYGVTAITALTVQNTQGVSAVMPVAPDFVAAEIDALFADIDIAAVKIGMLGSAEIAKVVAGRLAAHRPAHIILDPVLRASSGDALAGDDVPAAILDHLAPLTTLVTPNLAEAAQLTKSEVPTSLTDMEVVAAKLQRTGFKAVLVKGGHLPGAVATDIFFDGTAYQHFPAPRIATGNTHGTGCTLSSGIAASLAKGLSLPAAIANAKSLLNEGLEGAGELNVGHGAGPLHHFRRLW